VSSGFKVAMTETDWMLLMVDNSRWDASRHAGRLCDRARCEASQV